MASQPRQGPASARIDLLSASLLAGLRQDIENESRNASFACGGRIACSPVFMPVLATAEEVTSHTASTFPMQPAVLVDEFQLRGEAMDIEEISETSFYEKDHQEEVASITFHQASPGVEREIGPVQISYGISGHGRTILLPSQTIEHDMYELAEVCQPAAFGRNGKDVYDESYRKALKLDTTSFCTDFCPYEAGIIDTITQILLPGVSTRRRGIRAELYKLNVYRGPSDKFKAHVDTPRVQDQIGSLVVCLPAIQR